MAIPIQFEMQCLNYKQQRKQLNNKVPYNTKLTEKNELNIKIHINFQTKYELNVN